MTSDAFDSRGDFGRRLHDLERAFQRFRAARRGEHMTITSGGIDVAGGSVTVRDGDVRIYNSGTLSSQYPSGRVGFFVGPLPGAGTGMRVDRDVDASEGDLILEVMEGEDGLTHIYNGYTTARLNQWWTWADFAKIDADAIVLDTPETTTDIANVVLDALGHVRVITSSAAAKLDITPLSIAAADVVAGLEPVTWRDRGQVERDEPAPRICGFVAEHVAAAAERAPALEPLVVRDADGRPTSVAYDRVPAMQHVVLVDHAARLAVVEHENAELRAELAELRGLVETLTTTKEAT